MKFRKWLIVLILLIMQACSDSIRKQPVQSANQSNSTTAGTKPPGNYKDTLLINGPSAVFYHPDSLQDLQIRAITDPGVYKSFEHESFYQMRYSRIVLNKYYPAIKIIEARNVRYLHFKKSNGDSEYIDLDTKNDPSGLIVFDGQTSSRLLDMTNIETELGFYFKK